MRGHRRMSTWLLTTTILLISYWPHQLSFGQAVPTSKSSEWLAPIVNLPAESLGIDFHQTDGGSGRRYIVETVLGSVAVFDYDNDGWLDVYFPNGAPLPGTSESQQYAGHRLFRNLGNWKFVDVTVTAGLRGNSYGMGVVVGDYDNDGDADLFLSNYGKNNFYINQGDGTFYECAKSCGLEGPSRFGAGNAFLDFDNDGDLDLYCASYVQFDFNNHKPRTIAGYQFHPGPNDYQPAADWLYRNDGNGRFTDVSTASGINALKAPGMGVLSADFDEDGDMDIFVANDQQPNFLWINDGHGHFQDDALLAGVAIDRNGKNNGNMGIEYADLNNDGRLDYVTSTYQDELPVLYRNMGNNLYEDATNICQLDSVLFPHVKWRIGTVDFDCDGDCDIFMACGHFLDNIHAIDDRTDVKVANVLLANDGRGRFKNVTSKAGSALSIVESSRGSAHDDLDNDGDCDLIVVNINALPTIGRTDSPSTNRRWTIELIGTAGNRDAVGARVTLHARSGKRQTQASLAGRGYESSYGKRLHFGTGLEAADAVEIRWPSGKIEWFEIQPEASFLRCVEGKFGVR